MCSQESLSPVLLQALCRVRPLELSLLSTQAQCDGFTARPQLLLPRVDSREKVD